MNNLLAADSAPRSDTQWVWAEIAALRDRWCVLEHPFYQRWSAGELTPAELQVYAAEYAHAVIALASASQAAVDVAEPAHRDDLAAHAREERDHIDLWRDFATETCRRAGGGSWVSDEPRAETVQCARTWARPDRSLPEVLAGLYAIESAQPAIAAVKLEGLVEHYGYEPAPATEYFSLHAVRDEAHAAELRTMLDPLLETTEPFTVLSEVESAYRANWRLLDGVTES